MKRTLLICMLLLAIVLSLAACGGEVNSPAGNEENNNPPSSEEGGNIPGDEENINPPSNEENENEVPHTHSFGEWEVTVNPNCTENGTKVRYCDCGEKQSESIPPIGAHDYGEWIVIKTANCGQDVEMARYCSCGAKQTEVIKGEGMHGEVIDPAVAPTCAATGLTEGKHCPYCNTVFVVQEVIPTLEHTYNTTYTSDNSFHWYACSGCGAIKDKAEHQVTTDGMCSVCDQPIGATEGIIYEKSEDGTYAEVVAYDGTATKIRIADTYEGLPVKTIYSNAFFENKTITSVIIPDSVTSIGGYAFSGCNSLTSVVIPDSVTSIGSSAFDYCTRLASIVIPDSVTSIGSEAFYYCSSLSSVVIPDSVTSIGISAFYNCSSLTSVVIPDSVTSIGSNAFDGCSKLQFNEYENCRYLGSKDNPYFALIEVTTQNLSNYTIHEDTRVIADYAFYSCSRLASIVIPDSVTSIGSFAFNACSSLTSVVICDSVTSIGSHAFYNCSSLSNVYYTGSEEEWKEITIGARNYSLTNATKHYNYVPEE